MAGGASYQGIVGAGVVTAYGPAIAIGIGMFVMGF